MNAFTLSIRGNLKPTALRHHVLELGNTLGICGFVNYRKDMLELYIHAEGNEEIILEFIFQINHLIKKHNLVCYTEEVKFEDYRDFKIQPLKNKAENNSLHSAVNSNTDLTQNNTEAQRQPLEPVPAQEKKNIPGIKKIISSLKHVGL